MTEIVRAVKCGAAVKLRTSLQEEGTEVLFDLVTVRAGEKADAGLRGAAGELIYAGRRQGVRALTLVRRRMTEEELAALPPLCAGSEVAITYDDPAWGERTALFRVTGMKTEKRGGACRLRLEAEEK